MHKMSAENLFSLPICVQKYDNKGHNYIVEDKAGDIVAFLKEGIS